MRRAVTTPDDNIKEPSQSLVGHLTELRKRFIFSAIYVGLGFAISWIYSSEIFEFIKVPISSYLTTGGLVFTAPMDKFLAHIKVSLLSGLILSCPFWLYELWKFISPGLYRNEKKFGIAFIFAGSLFFLLGVSFVYFVVFPMAFEFLLQFGGEVDAPMITIKDYLSFFTTVTLVFGLAFEMPLVLTIFGMMGIIKADFLRSKRRYAIVLLAGSSAILTPPDIISMFAMLVPLILLYELSILSVAFFGQIHD